MGAMLWLRWMALLVLSFAAALQPTVPQNQIPSRPEYASKYSKLLGVLQYGDVATAFGENERYLSAVTGAFTAPEVGTDGQEDWGLVHPSDEEEHGPVGSGDLVALRSPSRGEFITFSKMEDNTPFGWADTAERAALFRVVRQSECNNPEKSTSSGEYHPSGTPLQYGDPVMIFPQSGKKSANVGRFSIYPQNSGKLYLTDSVVMGWKFELSSHNSCTPDEEEAGVTCCSWQKYSGTNQGVLESERRVCCKRTGHHLCHSVEDRIRRCTDDFAADQAVESRQQVLAKNDQAAAEALAKQTEAAATRDHADRANAKVSEFEMELEAQKMGGASVGVQQRVEQALNDARATADKANQGALSAQEAFEAAKAAAAAANAAWALKASGGKCCAWVRTSAGDSNPAVSTHRCCVSTGCEDQGKRLAHRECNFFGALVDGHCDCDDEHGGLKCTVQADSSSCFDGSRKNGVAPSLRDRCTKCYKCREGAPVIKNGEVIVAGDDFCVPEAGPETLCLACPQGAGLLRLGDAPGELDSWSQGYRDRAACIRFPRIPMEQPLEVCSSACLPRLDRDFSAASALGCTSVCSVWNQVSLDLANRHLEVRALCHVTKESQCHNAASPMGAALTANPTDPTARKCSARKQGTLAAICHMLHQDGTAINPRGYGSRCEHGSVPLASMASWHQTEHTSFGAGEFDTLHQTVQECQRTCLLRDGCPNGFSFKQDRQCRIPKHPLTQQGSLVPVAGWVHHRWTGLSYSLTEPEKWCCWLVGNSKFTPPDWIRNIHSEQYCAPAVIVA